MDWNPLAVVAFVAANTVSEHDFGLYSDLHKDAYGFRPRNWETVRSWTRSEFDAEVERLAGDLEQAIANEARAKAEAVAKVEATIANLIASGAADRTTAIRWLDDANEAGGDLGYLEFLLGLPYGHLVAGRG